METLIALLLGIAGASAFWIAAMRRAKSKPEGKTATVLRLLGA